MSRQTTNMHIDEVQLRQVEQLALDTAQSVSELVEESLQRILEQPTRSARSVPTPLTTSRGKGLQKGAPDINDNSALADHLDHHTSIETLR
jgi:hypothetical protein